MNKKQIIGLIAAALSFVFISDKMSILAIDNVIIFTV
jgi:hypothetical protein